MMVMEKIFGYIVLQGSESAICGGIGVQVKGQTGSAQRSLTA